MFKGKLLVWEPLNRAYGNKELGSREPSPLASAYNSAQGTGIIALATYSSEYPGSFRDTSVVMGDVSDSANQWTSCG